LIDDDHRSTLEGACEYITEALDCEEFKKKVARALEYKRILEEQKSLGRGLIWGGVISVFIWVALGVIFLTNF
jgi:hypothetical protein